MNSATPVADAIAALHGALTDSARPIEQAEAADRLGDLLCTLAGTNPKLFAQIALRRLPAEQRPTSSSTAAVTASMLKLLHEDAEVFSAVIWLLRLIQPRWIQGGELRGEAPAVADVAPHVLAAIDGDAIDANGFAAVILGRYGPEAAELLPELMERLRRYRTDCSRAPGLTWSVYMIGGLRPAVRELMIEIVTLQDSCPHSKKLAAQILTMNEVQY